MKTREYVDFHHVLDRHAGIHLKLEEWRRYVKVRKSAGWLNHPMWKNALSSRQWDVNPHIRNPINTIRALLTEKTVSALPDKHRDAIRWMYVYEGDPLGMARYLGVSKQGLADLVFEGRVMLLNRLGND